METIIVEHLRHAANNKALEIGEAWNLLEMAAVEIERLEAECFTLAAGVCEYRSGNEHGNPICLKTNELI